ncbi:hypothetical protein NE848_14425 [Gramella jeungdoensis]|uniref:Rhodopsin n=1 Tax=Gramella jeungdoensis TaxID=708091 RepID=A0ABT0Z4C4_9FLAO|nr:hypothetical protein [Gramella jeungdoensis]MCM8570588.1 hypothetical protein [Gramella jeungdoensis]
MWEVFIDNKLYPTYICELFAAIAGVYYLKKNPKRGKDDRLLVYYLVFIFIFDLLAITYGLYGFVYDFKYLEFIKGTPFESHIWIYNVLALITTTAYTVYFLMQLESTRMKKVLLILVWVFIITSIFSYLYGDAFFIGTSPYAYIFGAFLISFSIGVYYLELIRSERILKFYDELALYISIGLLLYKLSMTPLFIFQRYIGTNSDFDEIFNWILKAANIFMYSVFVFGFLRNAYREKREYKLTG